MLKAILLASGAGLGLFGALALTVTAIIFVVRKKNQHALGVGVVALVFAVAGITCTAIFVTKSVKAVGRGVYEAFEPRSNEELFKFVLDMPVPEGTTVLHSQDDPLPLGGDPAYWLHFKTTPETFARILALHKYVKRDITDADDMSGAGAPPWWKLSGLEGAEAYTYDLPSFSDPKKAQGVRVVWTNTAHTEVFLVDCYY